MSTAPPSYITAEITLHLDKARAERLTERDHRNLTRLAMALADGNRERVERIAREALAAAARLPEPITPDTPIAQIPGVADSTQGAKLLGELEQHGALRLIDLFTRCEVPLCEIKNVGEITWRRFLRGILGVRDG